MRLTKKRFCLLNVDGVLQKLEDFGSGANVHKSCRDSSRKVLNNAPTLAIRGVDIAENEPPKSHTGTLVREYRLPVEPLDGLIGITGNVFTGKL